VISDSLHAHCEHDHQEGDGDDDLRQEERRHDEAGRSPLAAKTVARDGAGGADAENGGEQRDGDADDEAVPGRFQHDRIAGQRGVPLGGEAGEREGGGGRVVEGEDRQQQDRQIEKKEIERDIGRKERKNAQALREEVHLILLTANFSASTTAAAVSETSTMVVTERAAPSGQLAALPNCAWMAVAIITPSLPPTRRGVT
jgi:hypothetical protein